MGKAGAIVEVYQVQAKIWSETKKLEEKTTESMWRWPLGLLEAGFTGLSGLAGSSCSCSLEGKGKRGSEAGLSSPPLPPGRGSNNSWRAWPHAWLVAGTQHVAAVTVIS